MQPEENVSEEGGRGRGGGREGRGRGGVEGGEGVS